MDKSIAGGVVAVVVILALALGGLAGVAMGLSRAWSSPEVVAQIARQEAARADKLQADAETEKAKADAAGAWSRSVQLLAIEWGRRWPVAVWIVLAAVALVLLGTSAAWVRWSWSRADVVPLPGGLIALERAGTSIVIDPDKLIGGLLQLDKDGVLPVLQTSEDLAADVARAALVASAVKHVGGSESRAELAARVTESLGAAFTSLSGAAAAPAPSMRPAMAAGGPALRLVPLRTPAEKKKADLANEAAELREFVERGAADGFQRSKWAGYKFTSTGRACSQTRWAILSQSLRDVELLDGSALVCDSNEALRRLGFEVGNAEESEREQ
jgi:hypothetical protein